MNEEIYALLKIAEEALFKLREAVEAKDGELLFLIKTPMGDYFSPVKSDYSIAYYISVPSEVSEQTQKVKNEEDIVSAE